VSVHPYRSSAPDTIIPDFAQLQELINQYAPAGKVVQMISGEYGYTTCNMTGSRCGGAGIEEQLQAKYLARMWISVAASNVPLSIYYDWKNVR
jgi:hypothetical protein